MRIWKPFCAVTVALLILLLVIPVSAAPPAQNSLAPTYRIFATREGLVGQQTANGHIIQPRDQFVALPSWTVLSSYQGYEFQVRLTYNGRSTVVPVWDVGPWNTNDDYWSPNRQTYSDLPVGLPMAQAAFLDGYNDGLDEFGRRINAPNGIDIADGTFWDSLGMNRNDWVDVTFLWLGADPGPGNAVPIEPTRPDTPAAPEPDEPAAPAPEPAAPQDNPQVEEGAITVDNTDAGFNATGADWEETSCGLNGDHIWVNSTTSATDGSHTATWTPNLPDGFYEVKAYIPSCGSPDATREARYRITHSDGTAEVGINQEAEAGTWASLGIYRFRSGDTVEVSDVGGDSERAIRVDALAWTVQNDSAAPESRITNIERQNNGYLVQWSGEDDVSGIATYDVQVQQLPRGGWRDWQVNTTLTEAWFGPDEGKHFAFRVRARDGVGNEEAWREEPDMDTTGVPQPDPTPTPEPPADDQAESEQPEEQAEPEQPEEPEPEQPEEPDPEPPESEQPEPEQPEPEQPAET